MKGMVFTEFLELVEARYSAEMVEQIIAEAELPSGGAYTAIGTYDHHEMVQLVVNLSRATGTPVPALLCAFGEHLFGRFVAGYPEFFVSSKTTFEFLKTVEGFIHVEVKKLYPDAELPRFDVTQSSPDELQMVYASSRGLADFAEGLIRGCAAHFGEPVDVRQEDLSGGSSTQVRFHVTRRPTA